MKVNIDTKEVGIQGSRMKMPNWAGRAREMLPASSGTILDKASTLDEDTLRIRGVNTKQDTETFNPSGLMGSGIYDEPITTDYSELSSWAQEDVPVEEEPDCTDWMVPAQAQVVSLKARANEYDRAGSSLAVNAGDPFQPGVDNGQMAFKSERAEDVENRGKADIVMADGNTAEISVPGAEPVITSNSLGWAAGTNFQSKQWVGAMMSVEELTNNPSEPIAFPTVTDNTGPLFVGHKPSRPSILNRTSVSIQSKQPQTVDFKLRSSRDYTKVVRSFSQDIPKGQSTTTFRMLALGIEPMAMEINPEDGTQAVLTDYSVFP
jgi:hypothetical protein